MAEKTKKITEVEKKVKEVEEKLKMSEKLLSNNKTNITRLEKEVSLWIMALILLSILKDLMVLLIFFEVKLFPKFLQIILRLKI